jgi:hypothetical protein
MVLVVLNVFDLLGLKEKGLEAISRAEQSELTTVPNDQFSADQNRKP